MKNNNNKKSFDLALEQNFATNLSYNLDGHCIFDVKYLDISLKHF